MADDKRKTAIDVVARRIIADEARATAGEFHVMHEIPSAEWEAVSAAITSAADGMDPGADAFEAAVEYLASRKDEVETVKVPVCSQCRRERTLSDPYDYNPIQAVTGQPLGWYSGDDGEMCPECMTKTLRGKW